MTMTRPTTEQITHNSQILKDVLGPIVSVMAYGAKGDGVTDDTAAINAALAALPNGGALYLPSGTYRVFRASQPDNIICDNLTIFGDGPATIINGNPFFALPSTDYSQNVVVFQATGRNNITIRDMSFVGACGPVTLRECTNIKILNIRDDAQLVGGDVHSFTITNITQSDTAPVITYSGSDPIRTGFNSHYVITGVVGMSQINGQTITIRNLNTTAKTFEPGGMAENYVFPTGSYSAYVSGGTATRGVNYMRSMSVYVHKCEDVLVHGCTFLNNKNGVYVSGDSSKYTSRCIVSNCHFEHTTPAGQYVSAFPCTVYWYWADECIVQGCTFVDIFSSQVRGNRDIGMGYAVYEGDGRSTNCAVVGNTVRTSAKGSLSGYGVYASQIRCLSVTGNTFNMARGSGVFVFHSYEQPENAWAITGNSFVVSDINAYAVWLRTDGTGSLSVSISGNTMSGGYAGIWLQKAGNITANISGNMIRSTRIGIGVFGLGSLPNSTDAMRGLAIVGNTITNCLGNAIILSTRVVQSLVASNVILDGNQGNIAGDSGAAIYFEAFSFGSTIVGNMIGNTPTGGGKFTYGISNATAASGRIFKDITASNSFLGLPDGAGIRFDRYWDTSPTNGIYDIVQGDFIENTDIDAGDSPGWHCVFKRTPELASNASSASTTITVDDTTGMLAGDIVLLTKAKDMCNKSSSFPSYTNTADWHATTVASVTNSTQFVLTAGIPAGDGTYVAGTAGVYVARFKAAAAIAS
jgi:hypothetical protein